MLTSRFAFPGQVGSGPYIVLVQGSGWIQLEPAGQPLGSQERQQLHRRMGRWLEKKLGC